jgi:hypothetical protein
MNDRLFGNADDRYGKQSQLKLMKWLLGENASKRVRHNSAHINLENDVDDEEYHRWVLQELPNQG